MQAQHQSSSDPKAITSTVEGAQAARHLMAVRIVGTALFDYQVRRTSDSRIRLESLTTMAHAQGDLSELDAFVVAQVLANPMTTTKQLQDRNHV
ncbi:hypothetical protein [Pseudomonas sp. ES3]|uniref:hypothetical protein n=1 Tax=Pseudomonas sp. ES3 TaxID=3424776 RepID=UPI003D34E099